ncbi:MAG: ribosome maturation factor RimP [Bacteroidota bacterium]
MTDKRIDTITELVTPLLEEQDLFLIDVKIHPGKEMEVWIYVDSEEGGVNLDTCADISRELGFLMEAHDLFTKRYRLNISSPGMKQALVDKRQYRKNVGRKARIKFKRNGNYTRYDGVMSNYDGELITLEVDDDEVGTQQIKFDEIVEASIIPSFK